MSDRNSFQVLVLALGMLLLWGAPTAIAQGVTTTPHEAPQAVAPHISRPGSTAPIDLQQFYAAIASARVVYLGESHDSEADHQAQLAIIQELYRRNPNLAIGMEMFQRPFQPTIDSYLRGDLSEIDLRRQTEYDQRWGFPWPYYAPILRFAQARRLSVLALNTPTEVTQVVAQKGLNALQLSDFQWIPSIDQIDLSSDAYRRWLYPIYEDFHEGQTSSADFENFFLAQVLWDETMADAIARFLQANPDTQVIVLTGQGHVAHGYGIPSRVARRMGPSSLNQQRILLNPTENMQREHSTIADFFWLSEDIEPPRSPATDQGNEL